MFFSETDEMANIPAERAVLSALLFGDVSDFDSFAAEDFYFAAHRDIFNAARLLQTEGKATDIANLFTVLGTDARVTLTEMDALYLSSTGYKAHKAAVKDASLRRKLIAFSDALRADAAKGTEDAARVAAEALEKLQGFCAGQAAETFASIAALLPDFYALVEQRSEHAGIPGLATGFADFDALTGGLQSGALYILAARPGMGKSAFASMVALNAAEKTDVLFFSMEMSSTLILQRLVAQFLNIPNNHLKLGTLNFKEWERFAAQGLSTLAQRGIHIDDRAGLSGADVSYTALRLSNKLAQAGKKIGLVVVDYLQIMGGKGKDRRFVVEENSRLLKVLAKRLGCPVMVLSQLNRGTEAQNDKRPQLHQLRETGAIEQDADLVAFLYRENYYDRDADDVTELIIAKQRDGALGTVRLTFDAATTAFFSPNRPPQPTEPEQVLSDIFKQTGKRED